MSNLLPKERSRALSGNFRDKLILVGALGFLCAAILAILALSPSYIALQIGQNLLGQSTSASMPSAQDRSDRKEISRSQGVMTSVAPIVSATSSEMDLLNSALEKRPRGVAINHIILTVGKNVSIVIDGSASDREEINQYKEALENDPRFTGASVPVGALLGAEGGKFTITASGAF